jgi:hypothetical protein
MVHSFIIRLLTIFSLFSLFFSVQAQNSKRPAIINAITRSDYGEGKVEIIQDKKIDELMVKYIDSNIKKGTITGYRICIFSDGKQSIAQKNARETRAKFISNFPDIDAEMAYERPDWRVFVGNFRNRTDAFRLKKQIESMYRNAYIIETQIEYTKF